MVTSHFSWRVCVVILCLWAITLATVGFVRLRGIDKGKPETTGDIAPPPPTKPGSGPLAQANSLVYRGAFRLPRESTNDSSFAYGGTGLAFNPARNSLFMVGHDRYQMIAEITIPEVRVASSSDQLATATLLQPFNDVTEGKLGTLGVAEMKIGGLLPYRGKLYASGYLYYDAAKTQVLSHIVSETDLRVSGDVRGPYQVGTVGAGFVSGYFGMVPAAWQQALGGPVLTGNCCLSIITRTSYGPAVFTIDPTRLGTVNPLPATPLVYYPSDHHTLGDWDVTSTVFNGSTEIRGVVFPDGTRSVLFYGRQGLGPFCYGVSGEGGGACHDPANPYKGSHAYPYSYYVWAYDANDLAAVKRREKQPWDVKPYAVWSLSLPFTSDNARIQGAAYDSATNRIFVTQAFGDGDLPLVHVFSIRIA